MFSVSRLLTLTLTSMMLVVSCGDEFAGSNRFQGTGSALPKKGKQMKQGEIGDRFLQIADIEEESFQQAMDESTLDLLVVVDNSGSMSEEQANLSTKLSPLLSSISESNWRIAVSTTDESDDCLRPNGIIQHDDIDASAKFAAAVQAGDGGLADEAGLHSAVRALSMSNCNDPNAQQWLREDSTVAVLIVSDEDNCSKQGFGSDCAGEPQQNPSYLTDYLSSIRELGVSARVYGLIWEPGSTCSTGGEIGYTYDTVIKATDGTSGSICDADYTQTLESISQDISVILESRFKLKSNADPSTIEVLVNGQAADLEYKVFGNIVSFKNPPPPGSDVTIKYRPMATEGKTRFKLSRDFEGDIFVKVGEEYLDASDYTVDESTNELVLRNAPSADDEVCIFYGEEGRIRESFFVEANIRVGALKVYVNEELTEDWDFENSTGILTFYDAPPENADIRIEYAK